jgi:CheY-like chemotaxis protein
MPATILLVDANRTWRTRVVAALSTMPDVQAVLEAGSGRDADARLAERGADLVIVGSGLPDVEALEWVRGLRARGEAVRVALLRDPPPRGRVNEPPPRDLRVALVLEKPVSPNELVTRVEPLLGPPPGSTNPGRSSQPPSPPPVGAIAPSTPSTSATGGSRKSASTEVDKGLAALRNDYAARLPEKLGALGSAIAASADAPDDAPLLAEARLLAHRLRGTTSAYGFPSVGEAAAKIEDALGPLPAAESRRHYARALQALEGAHAIVALLRGGGRV